MKHSVWELKTCFELLDNYKNYFKKKNYYKTLSKKKKSNMNNNVLSIQSSAFPEIEATNCLYEPEKTQQTSAADVKIESNG